ncbi:BRCT domain-containing protein At4g02110 [Linum perenne]
MDFTIPGMETVVASVSGYHGSERFKLIKLISLTGASYVGSMSRSTTHLVCWKFEGEKYVLAKKFRIKVVNHQWIEDCIKQGRLIPEGTYMLQSGKEVGPLSLQIPISDKLPLNKNGKLLSDISNTKDSEDTAFVSSSDPVFLNKDLFSADGENRGSSRKSKLKKVGGSSKRQDGSSSRKRFQDPRFGISLFQGTSCYTILTNETCPFSAIQDDDSSSSYALQSSRGKRMVSEHEELQTRHVRRSFEGKRNSSVGIGDISMIETSQKGRRCLKKYNFKGNMETIILDSDEESCPVQPHDKINTTAPAYTRSDGNLYVNESDNGGMSYNSNGPVDDVEHISNENNDGAWIRSTSSPESSTPWGSSSKRPALENSNMKLKEADKLTPSTRADASAELSCVICWTEFSATRGVLPCGHRFCYSCIDSWAQHMYSMRKVSKCPLCKASFVRIMKVEDADCSDQKIYSQTIPGFAAPAVGGERQRFGTIPFVSSTYDLTTGDDIQSFGSWGCIKCRNREPEDLLVRCGVFGKYKTNVESDGDDLDDDDFEPLNPSLDDFDADLYLIDEEVALGLLNPKVDDAASLQ